MQLKCSPVKNLRPFQIRLCATIYFVYEQKATLLHFCNIKINFLLHKIDILSIIMMMLVSHCVPFVTVLYRINHSTPRNNVNKEYVIHGVYLEVQEHNQGRLINSVPYIQYALLRFVFPNCIPHRRSQIPCKICAGVQKFITS